MRQFLWNSSLTRISACLVAMVLVGANLPAPGQQPPLVYTQENTGAGLYPAPVFPSFADLPIVRQLPDPFVFLSGGHRDTKLAALEHHRQDWLAAMEQYEVGPKPACTGTSADSVLGVAYTCSVTASYTMTSANHYTLTIKVTVVGPSGSNTVTTTAAIVTPTLSTSCVQPDAGWPIVIGMTGPNGSWPASAFNASTASPSGVTVKPTGCAATVNFGTAYAAFGAYGGGGTAVHANDGFYKLYPTLCAGSTSPSTTPGTCNADHGFPNGSNSGEYADWAFAFSRIVDGLEDISSQTYCNNNAGSCPSATALPLDITHSATTGCSYAGKMAMWTAALDERIALAISQENGGGGEPSWRISHEIETQGSVEDINDTSYSWFDTAMLQFSGLNAYKMPTDHFELMALMAPRALLTTGDSEYYWLGDRSGTFDDLATEAIYNNYGIGDRFNWYIDTNHFHCQVPAYQQNATQPIINRFLFGADVPTNVKVSWQEADALQPGAQPTYDPNFWTAWWGEAKPKFPAGDVWNEGGDVMLPLKQLPGDLAPPLTINTGDTITSQYQLSMPGTHAAATVTVPTSYTEIDVACTDGSSYTFAVPPPLPSTSAPGYPPVSGSPSAAHNSQTFTIAANDNSVFPSAVASTTNPGCSNGVPGRVTGSYFFALGLPQPGAGNPGLTGFSTTNGVQGAAQTDPLNVTFNLTDSSTRRVYQAPTTTINRQNPYSCTPNGCPLTPTITWAAPAAITYGTPLSSDQLNAEASATEISGLAGEAPGTSGMLTSVSVPGTWAYSPAQGTVLPPGNYTLTVTFTPTNIYTAGTSTSTAYRTFTAATASVPITVLPPPHGQ